MRKRPGPSMEPGSRVVNRTRAMEALSPWLNHPRETVIKVEILVVAAAALLLLQLILGSLRQWWQSWHRSFLKYGLQMCNGIMLPLIVYTLGTMQSSPIKNSLYPVWAAFLIMASAGTTAFQQYDFYDSFYKKFIQVYGEYLRDAFHVTVFVQLLNPNAKTIWVPNLKDSRLPRASSYCVNVLVTVVLLTKLISSYFLVGFGYKKKWSRFVRKKSRHTEVAEPETSQETAASRMMKRYKYYCGNRSTIINIIDQIRKYYGNFADDNALEDLCIALELFLWLLKTRYFELVVSHENVRLNTHDWAFKKFLTTGEGFQRAFRVVEVELSFSYDFFFTKYFYTFAWMSLLPGPFILPLILLKIIVILIVGLFAIKKSLVLETPKPIIEVHSSEADYIITILVLGIALLVELVQTAFYLASNWAQVSLAHMHASNCFHGPNAFIFGKIIGFLRMFMIPGQLRNKIDQHSIVFQWKKPDPVVVSDVVKKAIGRSLSSAYNDNQTISGEISVRLLKKQDKLFGQYSWALEDLTQLEVMLIWHIATEYCEYDVSDNLGNGTTRNSNHHDPRRNKIARDGHRGVAVHLSRYFAYLIGSVPELLPYHEADIAELAQKVMEEHEDLFGSSNKCSEIYDKMTQAEIEDDPRKIFQKGVKLGKHLKSRPDADRWEVLKEFWSETIIHVAASHNTTKQHMQHLENGGEFLTHIWALLAHAGTMMKFSKEQEGQGTTV